MSGTSMSFEGSGTSMSGPQCLGPQCPGPHCHSTIWITDGLNNRLIKVYSDISFIQMFLLFISALYLKFFPVRFFKCNILFQWACPHSIPLPSRWVEDEDFSCWSDIATDLRFRQRRSRIDIRSWQFFTFNNVSGQAVRQGKIKKFLLLCHVSKKMSKL